MLFTSSFRNCCGSAIRLFPNVLSQHTNLAAKLHFCHLAKRAVHLSSCFSTSFPSLASVPCRYLAARHTSSSAGSSSINSAEAETSDCSNSSSESATSPGKPTLSSFIAPSQIYDNTIDLTGITDGSEELQQKLRVLCLEHEVLRQEGGRVPRQLTVEQWREVLTLDTRSKRRKYYMFLFGIEVKKDKEKLQKEERVQRNKEFRESLQGATEEDDDGSLKYGLSKNCIMLRVYETTMNNLYNGNVIRAMHLGQKVVIDCGYEEHMTRVESHNCAKQLMITFSENRLHVDPFDVHLCNAQRNSRCMQHLLKYIPNAYEAHFPLNISEASYLDLFPKQDLVYLTPHCRMEMKEFDHDAVYIIGGIVDKSNHEPLSLAKAKREGLRMAKLPLDRYLQWGEGSGKSLTINQMVSILLDLRHTESWEKALAHVPRRKIVAHGSYASQPRGSARRCGPLLNDEDIRDRHRPNKASRKI